MTFLIHCLDLLDRINGERVLLVAVRKRIPHDVLENIFFDQVGIALGGMQYFRMVRKMLQRIEIAVQFIIETALEASALSAEFCLVDAEVLVTRHCGGYTFELVEPAAATEFPSATSDATHFCSFLAGTDLFHFDFHLEVSCVYLDQFTEIDTVLCCIEKGGFSAIGLKLNFTDFHAKFQLPGNGRGLLFHGPCSLPIFGCPLLWPCAIFS